MTITGFCSSTSGHHIFGTASIKWVGIHPSARQGTSQSPTTTALGWELECLCFPNSKSGVNNLRQNALNIQSLSHQVKHSEKAPCCGRAKVCCECAGVRQGNSTHTASAKFPLKPSCWRLIISSCCLLISSSRRLRSSSCLQKRSKDAQHNIQRPSTSVLPNGSVWKPAASRSFCWGCTQWGTSWCQQEHSLHTRTLPTVSLLRSSLSNPAWA